MNAKWLKRLKEELLNPLPGVEAQRRLSPPSRLIIQSDEPARKSAVLIMLYPMDGKLHTVFIKRQDYNGIHSGQVSLPGGMYKDSDNEFENTALRETWEETGVPSDKITLIGKLTSLHIPISGITVFPFVGVCKTRPEFKPDPFEVKYLIETSIEELQNPQNQKLKLMTIGDKEIEIPYFDIHNEHIWGATAMILAEFLEVAVRC
jgi:8-oxo-dGTP pyrophosphatase MutT (NUDIX family)